MSLILAPIRSFGVDEFNCVSEICLTPTPVAMVKNFENFYKKCAITGLPYKKGDMLLIPGDATSRRLHCEL